MDIILNNIDRIYNQLNTDLQKSTIVRKIDGITIEGKLKSTRTRFNTVKTEIEEIALKYNIQPVSIEQNTEDKTLFAIQFPELNNIYTDKELEQLYNNVFNWLITNAIEKTKTNIGGLKTKVTKQLLLDSVNAYVKISIDIFCKSSINPYKENKETYTQDINYINKIKDIYNKYVTIYCNEHNIH